PDTVGEFQVPQFQWLPIGVSRRDENRGLLHYQSRIKSADPSLRFCIFFRFIFSLNSIVITRSTYFFPISLKLYRPSSARLNSCELNDLKASLQFSNFPLKVI